ncbi:DUF4350 domain-containing protein [Cryobacterium tagatosivorans]|uniref:DUF4350 domain-containing protein n=1 Tax=Cryobacterium tagatosivorans TaxID=1259199 RepID=A0A4R8UG25_9MICO|nr:DUF4350 domain-containing protein [Cryobacterium tagatosivorans]TFB53916.1 DUF4350 domain-containing protein [Cryobacterium tagatosivorans]
MTAALRERPPAANAPALTPTLRVAGRRWLFWILAGAAAILVSVAAALVAGGSTAGGTPLAADNAAEAGSRALVEVLRSHGVSVVAADTLEEARSAARAAADPTVFFSDAEDYLDATRLAEMAALAPRTVLADPHFAVLQALAPEVAFGGVSGSESPAAGCDLPAAVKAGELSPGGNTLTLVGPEGPAALTGCFPADGDRFGLIERRQDDRTLTLLVDDSWLSNGSIDTFGNAALALNLLGQGDTVVWYLPTLADLADTGPPSLGELTPVWVTPTLLLLALTAVASFLWRGRRFGPLVAENLPVTVRAGETMEGRARLYARGDARLHAIDALRMGATLRLATRLGLPRTVGVDEVVLAVAEITGRTTEEVGAVLVDAIPANDRELVDLAGRLADLEHAAGRQAAPPPHGRMSP